jgi:4-hydroxybenzoate polyprenyltransferase/phosphoserine phosphatase
VKQQPYNLDENVAVQFFPKGIHHQKNDSGKRMMSEATTHAAASVPTESPLCVDLDGTLVKSDTLYDSLLVFLRTRPSKFPQLFARLFRGKAAFKAYVIDSVTPDVAHLPYNRKLLQYLEAERARGREIYLTTGADVRLAQRVADHLGIFTGVLGSDGQINLTANHKLDRLRAYLKKSFSYIGNATPDLSLLAEAAEPMVANPTMRLRARMRARGIRPVRQFRERVHPLKSVIRAIRIHQWAKNLLIFAPLLLAHDLRLTGIVSTVVAFFCFSLLASATYIVNDLLDIEADRRHPRKRRRPFAAGDLSAMAGLAMVIVLGGLALAGARLLPIAFLGWLLVYLASTLAYSIYLKRVPLVDVLVLSGLYTIRLLVGGAATGTAISQWLAGFSVFLFFSLALVKRFAELESLRARGSQPKNGRGYLLGDIEQLRSFGTASAFAAVVIFAIYIGGHDVMAHYARPVRLWLAVPLLILWLSRVWLLAARGELNEDPVIFAFTDRMSLLIGALVALVMVLAHPLS